MNIDRHFKRQSKVMIWLSLAILIAALSSKLVIPKVRAFIKIDKCVDNGGSFNYEICECDFQNNHEIKEEHIISC